MCVLHKWGESLQISAQFSSSGLDSHISSTCSSIAALILINFYSCSTDLSPRPSHQGKCSWPQSWGSRPKPSRPAWGDLDNTALLWIPQQADILHSARCTGRSYGPVQLGLRRKVVYVQEVSYLIIIIIIIIIIIFVVVIAVVVVVVIGEKNKINYP